MKFLAGFVLIMFCWLSSRGTLAQEIFRWVDEKGTIHFADNLQSVPERYRNQTQKRSVTPFRETPPPVPATKSEQAKSSNTEKYAVPLKREGGHLLVDVKINGQSPVPFVVDTGAQSTTIPASVASRLGLSPVGSLPINIGGVGGVAQGRLIEVDSIAIGEIEVRNLDIIVTGDNPIPQGLLGADFLSRFQIDIRYSSDQMLIQPGNGPYGGYPGKWWQERFRRYHQLKRDYEQRIKIRKEQLRSSGINPDSINWESSANSSNNSTVQLISRDLKAHLDYLKISDNKITELERGAAQAGVPRDLLQ